MTARLDSPRSINFVHREPSLALRALTDPLHCTARSDRTEYNVQTTFQEKTVSRALQEIVCCLGQPVAGNPTQFMMERAFAAAGLDWRYLTLEVPPEQLADAVRGIRALGFRGGNFTIPHKVAVIPLLDELSQAAELMGAVNCVNRVGNKLIGENTDGKGFVQSLRTVTDPTDQRIVILGAGGAARAIAVELALTNAASFTVVNRQRERGEELVKLLNERLQKPAHYAEWKGQYEIPADCDVLINATSIGLGDAGARVPVQAKTFRAGLVAADVIFNPAETRFLREAADQGATTLDGLGMLVNQAVIGFKIWTGVEPDASVMRDALEEFLSV
jgi:shikimate dehydrogenase